MANTMSTFNGLEIVDEKAREDISLLDEKVDEILDDLVTILASI
jgi:hypothetical protein